MKDVGRGADTISVESVMPALLRTFAMLRFLASLSRPKISLPSPVEARKGCYDFFKRYPLHIFGLASEAPNHRLINCPRKVLSRRDQSRGLFERGPLASTAAIKRLANVQSGILCGNLLLLCSKLRGR
jgi:hypothetical protein